MLADDSFPRQRWTTTCLPGSRARTLLGMCAPKPYRLEAIPAGAGPVPHAQLPRGSDPQLNRAVAMSDRRL